MKQALRKILTGLTVLLLFPVVIAIVYEYTRINENEEHISTVYKEQLETVITSINYYTGDIASNWASRIDLWLMHPSDTAIINRLSKENASIRAIYLSSLDGRGKTVYRSSTEAANDTALASIINSEKEAIEQLNSYYDNNYRKFISYPTPTSSIAMLFICKGADNENLVCIIELELQQFLQHHINPRIQAIARDNFLIELLHVPSGTILLRASDQASGVTRYDQEGEMWLFPTVKIGITLKQDTITDLASKKVKEGMLLLGAVLLILIAGIWFLYSSVKKEIKLAQIKSEFISNVSHEIRTPLALISMYAETLEMGRISSEEKIKGYYRTISAESERLNGMIDNILNFSQLESGKRKYKFEVCRLNDICTQIIENYESHFKNNHCDVSFEPSEALPRILSDKQAIAEALINLIDNAVKYSRDNKKIEISTGVDKKMCFVEVKDYGIGIARKDQKLIFDKFYRVSRNNLANEVKGTGLGLSLVCEIIKSHKGKVSLQSKPEAGSTFRLYFPTIPKSKNS